jgi:hypothetical protein
MVLYITGFDAIITVIQRIIYARFRALCIYTMFIDFNVMLRQLLIIQSILGCAMHSCMGSRGYYSFTPSDAAARGLHLIKEM